MKFGPIPVEIYEMAKGEALWLAELGRERYPWELRGYHVSLHDNEKPNLEALSPSDMDALRNGFLKSLGMNFNERTAATHGPDWQAAELGYMKYEDMIDKSSQKSDIVAYLKENSQRIRIKKVIKALEVIWIFDKAIHPKKWKMAVCIQPDCLLFFRINSSDRWKPALGLEREPHHTFLAHDSFIECNLPFKLTEYEVEQSLKARGVVGTIHPSLAPAI